MSAAEGVLIPAAISVPPGGTYLFATNPIDFIPYNPIVAGINITYEVSGNYYGAGNTIICMDHIFIGMNQLGKLSGDGKTGSANMRVAPNPVKTATEVHYAVENIPDFNGGTMEMYSLTGNLIKSQIVYEGQGQISFDMNGLAAGTYVVVFFSQGQRIGQQIIIKN